VSDQVNPILLVLAGPAGSGKSTLCDRLVHEDPTFTRVVTTTSRPPRPGEINGIHYHFFTPDEFEQRIAAGEFLEWAQVHGKNRNRLYGTLASSVLEPLKAGRNLIMSVDVQGVESFRRAARINPLIARNMKTVFIVVDHERLVARMRDRAQDNEAEIAGRMKTAERELREAHKFDYKIPSASKEADYAKLLAIIDQARGNLAGGE
jgi:guanylate kinase